MCRLELVKIRLVDSNGFLQLFYIFGSTLSEGGLRLAIALLSFLGRSIDLLRLGQHDFPAGVSDQHQLKPVYDRTRRDKGEIASHMFNGGFMLNSPAFDLPCASAAVHLGR